jgi:hypothetical protein
VHARADIVTVLLRHDTLRSVFALRPVRRLCQTLFARSARSRSTASRTAPGAFEPVRIVAVGRFAGKTPVYNLTVDDAHLFYANGVLSSNTDMEDHAPDSCRYACMSRPFVREAAKEPVVDTWERAWRNQNRRQEVATWRVA